MKIVCYTEPQENGLLLHYPSQAIKSEMLYLWESVKGKYNGYLSVELKKPYKPRTTGKGSQNNLFWALVKIICDETGEEPNEVEHEIKMRAIGRGYPYHISNVSGKPTPESMTKVNTVEMSYLIDTAYEIIAFLGITLEPELQKGNEDTSVKQEQKIEEQARPRYEYKKSLADEALEDGQEWAGNETGNYDIW